MLNLKLLIFTLCALLSLSVLASDQDSPAPVQIAIIMDDIAAKPSDEHAFKLPKEITFSILPFTEYSTPFSYAAAAQNREVMLHMPMENLNGKRLGPKPLLASMYPDEIALTLTQALKTVPHAVGMNNHMGSKLTQLTLPMHTVMQVLAEGNLFFIDSKTTRYSKAAEIAQSHDLVYASRQVFLDHEQNPDFIRQQLQELIRLARVRGKAIGIAHPYPVTLKHLPTLLSDLPKDVHLVTVSSLLNERNKFRSAPDFSSIKQQFMVSDTDISAPK